MDSPGNVAPTHSEADSRISIPRCFRYSLPSSALFFTRARVSAPDFGAKRTPTTKPKPRPRKKLDNAFFCRTLTPSLQNPPTMHIISGYIR